METQQESIESTERLNIATTMVFNFFDSDNVPDEIKHRVASFLPARDAIRLSMTCKSLHWSLALERLFPSVTLWDDRGGPPVRVTPPSRFHHRHHHHSAHSVQISPYPLPLPTSASKIHSVHVRLDWRATSVGALGRVSLVAAPNVATTATASPNGDSNSDDAAPSPSSFSSHRKMYESPLLRSDRPYGGGTVQFSFHPSHSSSDDDNNGGGGKEEEATAYYLWFEFAAVGTNAQPVSFTRGELSILILDDPARNLSRCHATLATAGALPLLPHLRRRPRRRAGDVPGMGDTRSDLSTAAPSPSQPSEFWTRLLLANCRLLRRYLDTQQMLVMNDDKDNECHVKAISNRQVAAVAETADLDAMVFDAIVPIFSSIGLDDITEPMLRAVEELVTENAKRHDEHRAMSDRIRAEEQAEDQRRRQNQQQQGRLQPQPLPALLNNAFLFLNGIVGDNNGGGDLEERLGAMAMRMEAGRVPQVFDPAVGDWVDVDDAVADRGERDQAGDAVNNGEDDDDDQDLPDELDHDDEENMDDADDDIDGGGDEENIGMAGLGDFAGLIMQEMLAGRLDPDAADEQARPPQHGQRRDRRINAGMVNRLFEQMGREVNAGMMRLNVGAGPAGGDGDDAEEDNNDVADLPELEDRTGSNRGDERRYEYWNGEELEIVD